MFAACICGKLGVSCLPQGLCNRKCIVFISSSSDKQINRRRRRKICYVIEEPKYLMFESKKDTTKYYSNEFCRTFDKIIQVREQQILLWSIPTKWSAKK